MTKKRKKYSVTEGLLDNIAEEVKNSVLSLSFFALTILFILSPFGKNPNIEGDHGLAGPAGDFVYHWLEIFLGVGYWILPLLLLMLGVAYIKESRPHFAGLTFLASFTFFLSELGLITLVGKIFTGEPIEGTAGIGGFLGDLIEGPLESLIEKPMTFVFLLLFNIVSVLIIFNARPSKETLMFWRRFKKEEEDEDDDENVLTEEEVELIDEEIEHDEDNEEGDEEEDISDKETPKKEKNSIKNMFGLGKNPSQSYLDSRIEDSPFNPPPLSLLSRDKGKPEFGDIKANTNIIKRTLQNFGISVEMDEVSVGPTVTRYSLKPAEGVKLSRIVGLQNDLSLALAAHPIRIEAPIPGKSLVGIEIPNSVKTTVGLGTLLQDTQFQTTEKPLLVGLGKAINGKVFFANIDKMPHVLIAGTTGSGKSVTVHTIINSLLFRNPPECVRFIMIDPKRVELTLYNNIPHLLTPVITDPKKAIRALKWATKEMERRYDVLETEKVRDIGSYHKNIYAPALKKYQKERGKQEKNGVKIDPEDMPQLPERMPYIMVVIDELADIMSTYPKELETGIVRLAQMSRAVGIHLVLSTQRPSVNIITGLIKANIPARIALQVSSQIDSRTILDTGGAEKLLGAGDMLYLSGEMSKPIRIQSGFISESEIKKVVEHIINSYKETLPDTLDLSRPENKTDVVFSSLVDDDNEEEDTSDDDELYEEARELVVMTGKASTSYLQRKLAIGYARAARIVDVLEERGVVGPINGSKPRDVYEKPELDDEDKDELGNNDYEE